MSGGRLSGGLKSYTPVVVTVKQFCQSTFYFYFLLKGTRHKQNSLSGNTLFNYMPTNTRSQKKILKIN